ncbi:MAG: hypothetical protein NC078_00775 [Ruminococcus sp.]|nr:hypothetical protein [Ruminococcus sp.]
MLGYFQRVKVCCTLAGAAAVLVGQKIAGSETIRKTAVDITAAGIRAVSDVKDFFKDIYTDAKDKVNEEVLKNACTSQEENSEDPFNGDNNSTD